MCQCEKELIYFSVLWTQSVFKWELFLQFHWIWLGKKTCYAVIVCVVRCKYLNILVRPRLSFLFAEQQKARIVHTSDECNVRWKKFRKASHLKRLNVIIIQRFRDSLWRDVEIKLIKKRTIKIHHHKTVKFIMNNLTWWIHRRFGCFGYSHYFQLSMTGSDEKNMHSL